ncbi:hypothetical protein [Cupriavidus nantongensis]|uniref:Uncharacterized protein n=1 Tax=Cupriavidus nantongensis TaxID=1796606 RepID=A0A142JGP5_9BURK|nr:hypothetical protein [Cupriavidus nantongensis]AMR77257.1 hypothetical protein A2G96_05660 [Cupriavidus nantongensis]
MSFMTAIFRYFDRRTDRAHAAQLESFLGGLARMTDEEIAELVVFATHVRHGLEAAGTTVLDPFTLMVKKPGAETQLTALAINLQRQGNTTAYAATAVWVHSLRAANRQTLRPLVAQMWRELRRGFPLVAQARDSIRARVGTEVEISDATALPLGLAA